MILFDEIERTLTGPAPNAMSRFDWINQCAEPYAERVRTKFETMLTRYPEQDREGLVRRFRSSDDSTHRGAVLELVLHEWVLAQGHEVLAVEPKLEHTAKRPDFLVKATSGTEYYLEAVARKEDDDRLAGIKDAIDAVNSPVYLDVTLRGQPTRTLSARQIAERVQAFIEGIDTSQQRSTWPVLRWEQDGVTFCLRPFSFKSEKNHDARTIGMFSSGAGMVSSTGDLEHVLKNKAGRYGRLSKPYIVATTTEDFTTGLHELTATLLGTEAVAFNPDNPASRGRLIRNPDGIWHGRRQAWTNTGLSGVLLIPDLSMTMLARRTPILMLHPEPRYVFNGDQLDAETHALQYGRMEKTKDGSTLGEVLDLHEAWPE